MPEQFMRIGGSDGTTARGLKTKNDGVLKISPEQVDILAENATIDIETDDFFELLPEGVNITPYQYIQVSLGRVRRGSTKIQRQSLATLDVYVDIKFNDDTQNIGIDGAWQRYYLMDMVNSNYQHEGYYIKIPTEGTKIKECVVHNKTGGLVRLYRSVIRGIN